MSDRGSLVRGGGNASVLSGGQDTHIGTEMGGQSTALMGGGIDQETMQVVGWIKGTIKLKGYREHMWTPEHDAVAAQFVAATEIRKLLAYLSAEGELVLLTPYGGFPAAPKSFCYWVRRDQGATITPSNVKQALQFGNIVNGGMDALLRLMSDVYLPTMRNGNVRWPESLRTDVLGQMHRFVASAVETAFQAQGKTVLYLPAESFPPEAALAAKDKDLVQRLEATVIHWTRQIKEVVTNQDNATTTAETGGPLDEIAFWASRTQDLSGISQQLSTPELLQIVTVLREARSSYLAPFDTLAKSIQRGSDEANDNLRFLAILRPHCEALATAKVKDIPGILPEVLSRIRVIGAVSRYFFAEDRMTGLLRKISNEVIKRCIAALDVRQIFDGDVQSVISTLEDCIASCQEWRRLYNETVDAVASNPGKRGLLWSFDAMTIFAQVEAFIQRCRDLIEVCEGQMQFARRCGPGGAKAPPPSFGGSRAADISRSLMTIEESFEGYLNLLREISSEILDVKSVRWHEANNAFKSGVKELEIMMANVINDAFQGVTAIPAAVDLLDAFSELARRPTVQRAVDKKAVEVYSLFLRQLLDTKAHFEAHSASPPLRPEEPRHSGAALWAKGLLSRVERDWKLLAKAQTYLTPSKAASDAAEQADKLMSSLDEFIRGRFLEWMTEISSLDQNAINTALATPLLVRSSTYTAKEDALALTAGGAKGGAAAANAPGQPKRRGQAAVATPYLKSNFDKRLLALLSEVHGWEQFEGKYAVPFHAADLLHSHEANLRTLREYVLLVCKEYNAIIASFDEVESKLFADIVRRLDRKVAPGLSKITWMQRNVKDFFIKDVRKSCAEVWAVVQAFKADRAAVGRLVDGMRSMVLVDIERNYVHEEGVFEDRQQKHRAKCRLALTALHEQMVVTMSRMYQIFKSDPVPVQKAWSRFIRQVDRRVEMALRTTVKNSLTELQRAICGDAANKDQELTPVFKLSLVLDNGILEYSPTILALTQMVNEVSREMITVVSVVPRLETTLPNSVKGYNATEGAIAVMIAKIQSGASLAATAAGDDAESNDHYAAIAAAANAASPPLPLFFNLISNDMGILTQLTAIMNGVSDSTAGLQKRKNEFDKYSRLWDVDKGAFMRKYARDNRPLVQIEADITRFTDTENEVRTDTAAPETIDFIKVDFTLLRTALVDHCQQWKKLVTKHLNDNAKAELEDIHTMISDATRTLSTPPATLEQLSRNIRLVKQMRKDKESIEARFPPLEGMYVTLQKFDTQLEEAELLKLQSLRPAWEAFQATLDVGDEAIKKAKVAMKKDLTDALASFSSELQDLRQTAKETLPYSGDLSIAEAKERLETWKARLLTMRAREQALAPGIEVFEVAPPEHTQLADTEREVEQLGAVWSIGEEWEGNWQTWKTGAFSTLDVAAMEEAGAKYRQRLTKLRELRAFGIWQTMDAKVKDFQATMPLIQALGNPAMRSRHWRSLMKHINIEFDPQSEEFTLEKVMEYEFPKYADFIEDLSATANKEVSIEKTLNEVKKVWADLALDIVEYKQVYFKLRSTEDISAALEEHSVSVSTMKASPYYPAFASDLDYWDKALSTISEVIELQLGVQRQWMYLESIFMASEDIRKMLALEAALFDQVNHSYSVVMARNNQIKNALQACQVPGYLHDLEQMDEKLERIQKALDQYLESKRQQFPRFYFLSNDDLLEILGQSKDPMQVQKHIRKCFEGIQTLQLIEPGSQGNKTYEALGMNAPDGEKVPFERKVIVDGPVELWLNEVERCMQLALQKIAGQCIPAARGKDKLKWVKDFPGQLLITAGMINWVINCEKQLRSDEPRKGLKVTRKRQVLFLNKLAEFVRSPLDKVSRKKLVALITCEIHNRDVMETMIKNRCSNVEDFEWLSQLRLEYIKNDGMYGMIYAKQTKSTLDYSYEYQGNNGRLVITPLTDRCVLTLTTALYLQRGGAPAGPAGTGKTETVKDLAKNLAKQAVVYNCSDGLDYKSVGKLFCGLVQSGAWGCFDEFNRIEVEVLSVIAQQILSIMEAIRSRKTEFVFMDTLIKCNWQCGIFITMNPGYAGRSELPDNLKSLFRPVAMMVPDLALIAEVMLQSEGFQNSRPLAKKTVTLYSLMVQQLSKQDHYDYGLRSLRGVLVCAGSLKRADPSMAEDFIVLRAIRDMNLPKFIKADAELFRFLLGDLFPSLELPPFEGGDLGKAIQDELALAGLQDHHAILQKCIELRDSKMTRHCNMLVGRTLSGKSTAWKMLQNASTALANNKVEGYNKVRVEVINPKSISMNELYGAYDLQTMEWTDGILSSVFRMFARDEKAEEKWLILDGPVDTLWIESMNTVMDDNKMLTLINGDRIGMTDWMSLLFEVQDLSVASPATVSRAGMIYLDVNDLGWEPYVTSWIQKHYGKGAAANESKVDADLLTQLFAKYVPRVLRFKKKECKELVPTGDFNAVIALCNMLRCVLTAENGCGKSFADAAVAGQQGATQAGYEKYVEKWFAFACIWSLGASVDELGRRRFNDVMREIEPFFPPQGQVYDYWIDPTSREMKPWSDKLNAGWRPAKDTPFFKITVPTVDTVRNLYVANALIYNGYHVLFVGNTGTGKTILAQQALDGLPQDSYAKLTINFSAATASNTVQDIIEGILERRSKNKMGPVSGKKLVVFVDDLNMPKKDTFGSQPPLELLRQWVDYGGWYDRAKQSWRFILDMQLVTAMGPPGGGRSVISERFQSRFNMINFTFPAEKQIRMIFESILSPRLSDFNDEVKRLAPGIVAATVSVYERVVEMFLPTPQNAHYLFNLRDIAKVIQGLLSAHPKFTDSPDSFYRLWVHECMRTFSDRFTTMDDVARFRGILDTTLHKTFEVYLKVVTEHCENPEAGPVYADFVTPGPPGPDDLPPYSEVTNVDKLKAVIEEEMVEYNSTPGLIPMNLVFFRDALRHVARIARILRTPRGNALLAGVGGSGRQSLARVAAFVCKDSQGNRMGVFQIEITKQYRLIEFHEDIKKLYEKTGIQNKPTMFLFSDTQVKDEAFLEDINNILSSGEVPNLYTKDEKATIMDAMRPIAKKAGLSQQPDELWNLFIERVRSNLHVVLAMSPVGDAFRNRTRMYPSLVNCTTIDWFHEWPLDALREVATKFLDEVKLGLSASALAAGAPAAADPGSAPSTAATTTRPGKGAAPAPAAAAPAADAGAAGLNPNDPESAMKGRIASVFAAAHKAVTEASARMFLQMKRNNYVTPTHYLELVLGYRSLLAEKRKELGDARDKLANGLDKLESSKLQVTEMQVDLAAKQKTVEKATAECDALLVRIVQEKRLADEQRAEVEEASTKIAAEEAKCKEIADEAEADLAEALPALEKAMAEVDKLDNSSIGEVKAYTRPPDVVLTVLGAVMTLFNVATDWPSAKKKISESDFLRQVKGFDKDNVPPATLKKLKKYTERPEFESETVRKSSLAAAALCTWVLAIELYSAVAREVEPKRAILRNAEALLNEKQTQLAKAKEQLAAVVAKVEQLNATHTKSVQEKTALQMEAAALTEKLERAEKLIGGLSGERVRWEASIGKYDQALSSLPGDSLVAAAFLSYAGPFDTQYREGLVQGWLARVKEFQIPSSADFNFANFLADPSDVRDWNIQGLPTDQFSTENGVIVTRGRRWPLMIDPQGQANKWIKEKEKKKGLKITDQKDRNFLRELEQAITYGLPYLLQDVEEEIDPALEPVLTKAIIKRGNRMTLKLGEKELDWSQDFRFYLTTKLPNPHYSPEVSTKVLLTNFAVKESGLEAQLLGTVVQLEEPRLEKQKSELVVTVATGKRKLVDLENTILRLLSEAKGSLLDDQHLVDTLQASKATSEEVSRALIVAEETEAKIDAARLGYRPVSIRAALLYFVLNDLSSVDPMYQFSLDAYTLLFKASINDSRAATAKAKAAANAKGKSLDDDNDGEEPDAEEILRQRIAAINDWHTYEVYKYACRGLFERHKLLLSFQICVKRMMTEGGDNAAGGEASKEGEGGGGGKHKKDKKDKDKEGAAANTVPKLNRIVYDFFLKGGVVTDRSEQRPNPSPEWLSNVAWDNITEMDKLEAFSGISGAFESAQRDWQLWYSSSAPEKEPLPGEWETKCDDLMKMTIVRSVRPDRVLFAAARFVAANLGPKYVEPPPFDLRTIYETSSNITPLVFVLSPGVDPTKEVIGLANSIGVKLEYCSLGQGQAPIATRMITDGLRTGSWVFLQNCHLSISWMPALEKIIEGYVNTAMAAQAALQANAPNAAVLAAAAPHHGFRLWLSSYPHPKFPISVLQRGVKMTTEPPRGLKANLLRLYTMLEDDEFISRSESAPGKYAKLLFCLCWFHAVLVERRKFKSLGWNIPYDFNYSDFSICNDILADYLSSYKDKTPWDAIRYLIAEVSYGGRVTDDLDRRLASVYVHQFFCDDMISKPQARLSALPDYYVPEDGKLSDYRDYLGTLPMTDPPEAFGQHPNADIQSAIQDTEEMLQTILGLQPRNVSEGGARPEDKVMATAQDLERALPQPFDMEIVTSNVSGRSDPEPLKVVLFQEVERYNSLLEAMKRSLVALQKGIAGTVVITPELEQIFAALLVGRVPAAWGFCYPSLKPLGLWFGDLQARIHQLRNWIMTDMPKVFWLSGFTYPTGFLTALLQASARKNGLAIDTLEFDFPVLTEGAHEIKEQPKEGAYVQGLFLEGAKWDADNSCLAEPEPMQLFAPMPIIHFRPREAVKTKPAGIYRCPMYLYPLRTGTRERPSFMTFVELRSGAREPEHWVKRGTALLLALST